MINSGNLQKKAILSFGFLFFALINVCLSFPANSQAENIKINNANSLEIVNDRLVLTGNVSVSTAGKESFKLFTSKLISVKDSSGDFSKIECFGRSKIDSKKFTLMADKVFFYKKDKSDKFNQLDAKGNVVINSKDGFQQIQAPKVIIDLETRKLYASQNVLSEQISKKNDKYQKVTIRSLNQEIDLKEELPNTEIPRKQLIATGNVITNLENEASVQSDKTELFTLNSQAEKAIFDGNASLQTVDGTEAEGDIITYDLISQRLQIDSSPQYNSNERKKSKLKVPFEEENGKQSEMIIEADFIENQEKSESERILTAQQFSDEELVELTYGTRKGWGRQLIINQNKLNPNKKGDYLVLVERAKIIDAKDNQILEAPVIKIGLGEKNLQSGFTGRANGLIPMKKKDGSKSSVF
ncbi:MAG: hypothetical protein QNJ31_03775 [Candidatus Caenarcaniphilales bacterium]|nr:hypothetical protein [Candidatus Caenarcaniphilales bacterium]